MRRGPLRKRRLPPPFMTPPCRKVTYPVLAPVSRGYPRLTGRLPTCYSPVRRSVRSLPPEGFRKLPALDLHVLGTPPAFVLSQDQTLQIIFPSFHAFLFLKERGSVFCSVFKELSFSPPPGSSPILSPDENRVNSFSQVVRFLSLPGPKLTPFRLLRKSFDSRPFGDNTYHNTRHATCQHYFCALLNVSDIVIL